MPEENSSINPKFSVIMNCLNGSKYLKQSINSLLDQHYQNWELIFWDNNSTDNSRDIFNTFNDKRLKYFFNNNKTSLYAARNLSINKAKGDYITFLDTDDYWLPEKLEKQFQYFKKYPQIKIIYGNYFILNEKLKTKKIAYKEADLPSGKIYNNILFNYNVGFLSVCFNQKMNIKFDERFDIIGDFDAIIKISKKEEFGLIKEPLSVYRFHKDNFSLLNKEKHFNELNTWYNENIKLNENISEKIKNNFKLQLTELKIIFLLLSKKKIEAYKQIIKINFF